MAPSSPHLRTISIILLAAGPSSRLGRPKQLLPYQGTTLLRHLANQAVASKASEVVVVVGSGGSPIRSELKGLRLTIVENKGWKEGIGSSIRAGLQAASSADALLIMLCDQPLVTTGLLNSLIAAFTSGKHLVACEYAATVGVPALFGKSYFEELSHLKSDAGAKSILLRHEKEIHRISFPGGPMDIDTEEDVGKGLIH